MLLCVLVSINVKAQTSISFTTMPTTAKVGTTLTVNYRYTSSTSVFVSTAINLQSLGPIWTFVSNVSNQWAKLPAGTNVVGSFSLFISKSILPSNNLPNNLVYRIHLEMKDATNYNWLGGSYPSDPFLITTDPFIYDVDDMSMWPSLYKGVGIGTIQAKSKLDIEGNLSVGSTYAGSIAAPLNGAIIEGNVGIGSTRPDQKLTVKGKIHAEEVIVDLLVPADYVFQKYYTGTSELKPDYQMPTLAELEKFTKQNNHLPNLPSAKEIQEKGLQLGEMSNLLLQKIEELTLYVIQQQKEIEALKKAAKK